MITIQKARIAAGSCFQGMVGAVCLIKYRAMGDKAILLYH